MKFDRKPLDASRYHTPPFLPETGTHPRLLFRAADLEKIRTEFDKPQNRCAYLTFTELCDKTANLRLDPDPELARNFSGRILSRLEAFAFQYALCGDETYARLAIDAVKDYIKTARYGNYGDFSRPMGQAIFTASEIYDWCYDVLTDEDKAELIGLCENLAGNMEIGYPPVEQGAVTGHAGEAQLLRDLLSFGVAVYDECPDIYEFCAGRLFDEFVAPRNCWGKSHTHHQGSAYGHYRYNFDMWAQWIIYRMSGGHMFDDDYGKVPYEWLYIRRSDGQFLRIGDDFGEAKLYKNQYWDEEYVPLFLAANFYKDPYLKQQAIRESEGFARFTYDNVTLTPVQYLLFNDPDLWGRPIAELPKTKYFATPAGAMIARTSWEIDTNTDKYGDEDLNGDCVLAYMRIGEKWAGNHQHLDAGNFQLYYKGILASESGCYDSYYSPHDKAYNKETIAHNTLLIYDPDEDFADRPNAGGQRRPTLGEPQTMEEWSEPRFETGKVLAHAFGPNAATPAYSYIAGDIAKAYSDKAKEVLRSMAFLPLTNAAHKGVLFIGDKVTAASPDFKKTFLLHTQEEPEMRGKVAFVQNTDAEHRGAMQAHFLLPKDAELTKIGGKGKEFTINGENYPLCHDYDPACALEAGAWRLENSPKPGNNTDYMLTVLLAGDIEENGAAARMETVETETHFGAAVYNTLCLFGRNAMRCEKATFDVPDMGYETVHILLTGMEEGVYRVTQAGQTLCEAAADANGGALWFDCGAGTVTVEKIR